MIVRRGDPRRTELDALEDGDIELRAEIEKVRDARYPHEETAARLKAGIEREMEQYVVAHSFGSWQSPLARPEVTRGEHFGLAQLAFILGTDAVVENIMERIKATSPPVGLPAATRAKKIADLETERAKNMRAIALAAQEFYAGGEFPSFRIDIDHVALASALWQLWGSMSTLENESPRSHDTPRSVANSASAR